ncbi:hypothetical protein B0H11DRAFT_2399077 [Mycena galericulata]|nr:hypothetical protein B0H11DRAFT_2399077 [Mycena galericulata]
MAQTATTKRQRRREARASREAAAREEKSGTRSSRGAEADPPPPPPPTATEIGGVSPSLPGPSAADLAAGRSPIEGSPPASDSRVGSSSLTLSARELEYIRALRASASAGSDSSTRLVPATFSTVSPSTSRRLDATTASAGAAAESSSSSRASRPPRPSVEEVDDEDDPPHIREQRAQARADSQSQEVDARSSAAPPPAPKSTHRSRASAASSVSSVHTSGRTRGSYAGSVGSRSVHVPLPPSGTGSQASQDDLPPPSPVPSRLNKTDVSEMDEEQREARRREKRRAPTSGSVRTNTSDRGRNTLPTSDYTSPLDNAYSEERPRLPDWEDDANLRAARDAIARERSMRENSEEYKRRREAHERAERQLREYRVEDDRAVAEQLFSRDVAAMDDYKFALQLQRDLRDRDTATHKISKARAEVEEQEAKAIALEEAARRQRAATDLRKLALAKQIEKEESLRQKVDATRPNPSAPSKASEKPVKELSKTPALNAQPASSTGERVTHQFRDRVILQRYRIQDLMSSGTSNIPDQGIDWNEEGKPIEVATAPSRGSSVGTRGGRVKRSPRASDARTSELNIRDAKFPNMSPTSFNAPAAESSERKDEKSPSHSEDNKTRDSIPPGKPPKDESRDYYLHRGTAPPAPSPDGDGGDSSDSDETNSSKSDDTYRLETNYSRSSESDSAFEDNIGSDDITQNSREGSAPHTRSGAAYGGGGGPPEDSGGESSSDSESPSRSPGPSRTPRRKQGESERSYRRRCRRNSRRNHHSHGSRDKKMHLVEPGDPVSAGIPARHMKKWRRSLHHHYEKFLKDTLGKSSPISSVFDENKNLKFPVPPSYSGSSDINKFDEHILSIGRWFELMGLGGRKNDHKRLLTHGFYLTGAAKDWYENQVVGMYRSKTHWTYRELVLGLFDRFIDTSCIQKATDQFWSAKYSAEIGVMGFYHELMTAARRMVKRPDSYTFKTQLMSRIPADMVEALIERNVTAEYCKIKEILECASNYEWHRNISRRYAAQRRSRVHTQDPPPRPAQQKDAPRMASGRRDLGSKRFKFVKREPVSNEPRKRDFRPDSARIIPRETPRPGGRDGGVIGSTHPYKKPVAAQASVSKPSNAQKSVACYNCGGPHYKNECPSIKRGPMMYAGRVDDAEEALLENSPVVSSSANAAGQQLETNPATSHTPEPEQLRQIVEDHDGPEDNCDGDQYDSDYTLEECSEYSFDANDERCAHMGEIDTMEEFIPSLQYCSDSDSDYDSESDADSDAESDESEKPIAKHEPTLEELGLYGVCDDYSDEEFVTDNDLDGLAKEMANCLLATHNPEVVMEYFSAGRERVPDEESI